MPDCPITQEAIEDKECRDICIEAEKDAKSKTIIAKKVKRIICWKGICKSCKHHVKE